MRRTHSSSLFELNCFVLQFDSTCSKIERDFDSLWSDPRKKSSLLELLARTEGIEEVNGASTHYMSVGIKR
jgi:hypothetical protein